MVDLYALTALCRLATKERHSQLRETFRKGMDHVRYQARYEIALAVASMELCKDWYTEADLDRIAKEKMANDPIFCAVVSRLAGLLEDYMDAARHH